MRTLGYGQENYGYLPNGDRVQPAEELARVERRSKFNTAAVIGSSVLTLASVFSVVHFSPDTPSKPANNDSIHQANYVSSQARGNDVAAMLSGIAAAFGLGSLGVAALRSRRDSSDKEKIGLDVQDGMYFDENGEFIYPHHYKPEAPLKQVEFAGERALT